MFILAIGEANIAIQLNISCSKQAIIIKQMNSRGNNTVMNLSDSNTFSSPLLKPFQCSVIMTADSVNHFSRKLSDESGKSEATKNSQLFLKLFKKHSALDISYGQIKTDSMEPEREKKMNKIETKINYHTKYNEHKQKLNKIKAKQQEIKKKTEGLLTNKSYIKQSLKISPVKCLSSKSSQQELTSQSSQSPPQNPQKYIKTLQEAKIQLFALEKPKRELISINSNNRTQHFQILRYVDEGSFGKVYLVKHSSTNFIYCLKMIEKSLLTQQNINQLIREIKIQSFLNHPNIINLYQYFIDSTFVYLLLQPCLGGNLFKHMSKQITNSLPEKDVKKYIKEILGTVDYLHKNDIIHRDIKPENILLHENTVKICDFGWAVYSPLLRSTQCGTPLYASPQMVKSQYYDNKIDIWCIGVLTFELLYGQAPFKINQISDIAKIVDEEIYFPIDSQISTNAIQFMKGCLEKKAVRRFEVRQAIEHDFIRLTRANEKFRSTII